jgi:hypothetical protein
MFVFLKKLVVAAFMSAFGLVLFFSTASAHHVSYETVVLCGEVNSDADYRVGPGRRLVVIDNVVVNGQKYLPEMSSPPSEAEANIETGSVIPISEYPYTRKGLPLHSENVFVWGGDSFEVEWVIFHLSGIEFVAGQENWQGTISLYQWRDEDMAWHRVDFDPIEEPTQPKCGVPKVDITYWCPTLTVWLGNFQGTADYVFNLTVGGVAQPQVVATPRSAQRRDFEVTQPTDVVVTGEFGLNEVIHFVPPVCNTGVEGTGDPVPQIALYIPFALN